MRKFITCVLLGILAGTGAACNKEDGAGASSTKAQAVNPVATVNIETVGKTMGWGDEITKILKQNDAEVTAEIEPKVKLVKNDFENKKLEIAKAAGVTVEAISGAKNKDDLVKLGLNPKQVEDFMQANIAVQQGMQQLNTVHQQVMQQRQAVVANAYYRDALQPVIRRVATANNRSVVIALPNQTILFSDATVDMTEKVVDDLQKNPPIKVPIPDMPPIPWTTPTPPTAPATQPK